MNAKDVIRNTIGMCHQVATMYLGDLNDSDLMIRPVPQANHIAWQLGHLIVSENKMMTDAGFAMPALPSGLAEAYTKETSTSNDAAKFHKKDQYLAWMEGQRGGTMQALDKIADAALSNPTPEFMHQYAATNGALFNLIGIHMMMHGAQFIVVRRKLGKAVMF